MKWCGRILQPSTAPPRKHQTKYSRIIKENQSKISQVHPRSMLVWWYLFIFLKTSHAGLPVLLPAPDPAPRLLSELTFMSQPLPTALPLAAYASTTVRTQRFFLISEIRLTLITTSLPPKHAVFFHQPVRGRLEISVISRLHLPRQPSNVCCTPNSRLLYTHNLFLPVTSKHVFFPSPN